MKKSQKIKKLLENEKLGHEMRIELAPQNLSPYLFINQQKDEKRKK